MFNFLNENVNQCSECYNELTKEWLLYDKEVLQCPQCGFLIKSNNISNKEKTLLKSQRIDLFTKLIESRLKIIKQAIPKLKNNYEELTKKLKGMVLENNKEYVDLKEKYFYLLVNQDKLEDLLEIKHIKFCDLQQSYLFPN